VKLIRRSGLVRAFGPGVSRMAAPTYRIRYYGPNSLI
jgi:hypothetical protein